MGNERQIIYDLIEQLGGFENSTVVLKDLIGSGFWGIRLR